LFSNSNDRNSNDTKTTTLGNLEKRIDELTDFTTSIHKTQGKLVDRLQVLHDDMVYIKKKFLEYMERNNKHMESVLKN